MKFNLKNRKKYLIAGGLLLATATPSFALFGIGDIVFDPTSYASLVSQATTALNQFKTIENNVTHFSFKQQWQTTLNALKNANVANMFGETAGFSIALNTNSPSASTTAWKTASVPVNSTTSTYLQGQTVGNSAQLSQLAMVEMSDSVSPDCLTAVGQYRAGTRPERDRKQRPVAAAVRCHVGNEQRGRAVEPVERRPGSTVDRRCSPRPPCRSALPHR